MIKLLKVCKYFLYLILILLSLSIICLITVTKTAIGTKYLFKAIPGLTVEESQGSLSGGWSAKKLIWQDDTLKITVANPQLNWSINCLLKANVCIESLTAQDVIIETMDASPAPSSTTQNTTITLPSLNLPISIDLNTFTLNKLTIDNEKIAQNISLSELHWQNAIITFKQLSAAYQDLVEAKLNGQITLENNWPLDITAQLNLDNIQHQPWSSILHITGTLQQQLALNLESTGFLQAKANAKLAALDETLPAELSIDVDSFLPDKELPESLRVKNLRLQLAGNLPNGYHLKTNGLIAGVKKNTNLELNGLITQQHINIDLLKLSTTPQQAVIITGKVQLQPKLQVNTQIKWQHFPWQELYPQDSIAIAIEKMQGHFEYAKENYKTQINADLTGPAGSFNVTTQASGDLKHILLETLQVKTKDNGTINGNASITFDPSIEWLAKLHLNNINPNYWVSELSGILSGTLDSNGTVINNNITTETVIDIKGKLQKQIAVLKAQLVAKEQQWQISQLLLKLGNNQVNGKVEITEKLDVKAELALNFANLKQILPELSGSLKGDLKASGSKHTPKGSINITGQHLSYDDYKIPQLKLVGSVNNTQQDYIQLQANKINIADTYLGNLSFKTVGNIKRQNTQLQLAGGIVELKTIVTTEQDQQNNWIASINQLLVHASGQKLTLDRPTQLTIKDQQITLNPHCLLHNTKATLCAIDKQQLYPEPDINYQIKQFELENLKPLLPENFSWISTLSAQMKIKLPKSGPSGIIEIKTTPGVVKVRESVYDTWVDFPYSTLQLSAQLYPQKIITSLKLKSNKLGDVETDITIDPFTKAKNIAGSFKFTKLNIDIFRPFLEGLKQLKGEINGSGNIAGTLLKPDISGKITLKNGYIIGDIPVTIENAQLAILINGETADIKGDWTSGKQGKAHLTGQASWAHSPSVSMQLRTQKLPIYITPYGEVENNSNLSLSLENKLVSLKGDINIPKGAIIVRDLPSSAVTVSSDTVIIGKKAEPKDPFKLNMDVTVLLGQEKLTFKGFGLNTDIVGTLRITKDLFTQGELNLRNSTYSAYGQQLKIRRAMIMFTGSITNPALNVEAIRTVDDITAGLRITGLVTKPQVTVFSEPSMSQEQALSYIMFGKPLEAENSNFVIQMLIALGTSGSSPTLGNIANKIGIKDFQLDTSSTGSDTTVVASGKLTEKLSVHYSYDVFSAAEIIMLRYLLTKKIYVDVATGTASSIDIIYKRSF